MNGMKEVLLRRYSLTENLRATFAKVGDRIAALPKR